MLYVWRVLSVFGVVFIFCAKRDKKTVDTEGTLLLPLPLKLIICIRSSSNGDDDDDDDDELTCGVI